MKLVKNPIYMCYVLGTTIRLFAVIGYLSFQSKYIETEYKNSASFANMITGESLHPFPNQSILY